MIDNDIGYGELPEGFEFPEPELEELPKANIVITGKTGVGKSTLINAIFGEELSKEGTGRPVTQKISMYTNSDIPVAIYDTVGLELDKDRQNSAIAEIKNLIREKRENAMSSTIKEIRKEIDELEKLREFIQHNGIKYEKADPLTLYSNLMSNLALRFSKNHYSSYKASFLLFSCRNEPLSYLLDKIDEAIEQEKKRSPVDLIHAVWYCVACGSNRFEPFESNYIKEIEELGVPVFVVMTQCTSKRNANKLEDVIKAELGKNAATVVQTLARDYETDAGVVSARGVDILVRETAGQISELVRNSFIAAQKVSKEEKERAAKSLVEDRARGNIGTKILGRVPLIRGVSISKRAGNMLTEIERIYGLSDIDGKLKRKKTATSWSDFAYIPIITDIWKLFAGDDAYTNLSWMGNSYVATMNELFDKQAKEGLLDVEQQIKFIEKRMKQKVEEKRREEKQYAKR
jgi:GTP-binding protein EngB required for normal cell division